MNNRVIDEDLGLSPDDLVALRENLEEQRRFRREQLRQIVGAPQAADDGSTGQEAAARFEVQVKLAASARMVLHDVEAALERLSAGRYGTCHLCTRSIGLARLTIVPQARYCARCQQVRETGR